MGLHKISVSAEIELFPACVLDGGYLATCLFASIHPEVVNVGHQPKQPVPFSHQLHAGQLKLDCRYCHNTVDKAAHAAIPPTATCGNCHGGKATTMFPGAMKGDWRDLGQIHKDSENLELIRVSLDNAGDADPVLWERVHDVPDFVYFNHSVQTSEIPNWSPSSIGSSTQNETVSTAKLTTTSIGPKS